MKVPLSRTIVMNETAVTRTLKDALEYPGTTSPAPTPAPVFTIDPAVLPAGGFVGNTYAANAYAASNATTFERRWLLRASGATVDQVLGTGPSQFVSTPGTLRLEVSAIGPGGLKTVKTSGGVEIVEEMPAATVFNTKANSNLIATDVDGFVALFSAIDARLIAANV